MIGLPYWLLSGTCEGAVYLISYIIMFSYYNILLSLTIYSVPSTQSWQLLLYLGSNRCSFQLLRSYKRHGENKSKIGQECSSMYQADYQHKSSAHSINARKCVYAQNHTPVRHSRINQAKLEEEGKREEERQRGWWKEKQPNKTKTCLMD